MSAQKLGMIIVALRVSEQHLEAIRAVAPEAEIVKINGPRGVACPPRRACAQGRGPSPACRATWTPPRCLACAGCRPEGAGNDWLLRAPEIANSDVVLTNGSGVAAIPIAEHVLTLMFTLSRNFHGFAKAQRDHEWFRGGHLGEKSTTARWASFGLGAIGEKTAEKAQGLNMRVLGLRRDPTRASPHVDRMLGPEGLFELLESSDWVVLASALTPETRGLIGEPELKAMKNTACLINIARGQIVQEKVLIQALREGWIAGAGARCLRA